MEIISPEPTRVSTPPPPLINRQKSPEFSGGAVESLSIEETNKLRAKLGLKPLQVEDKSAKRDDGKRKDDLGEFYHKPAHSLTVKAQQEKIRSKLSDYKEKRKIDCKLSKVKLLGDADSDDDDAIRWVEKNRRVLTAKEEANKRASILILIKYNIFIEILS